PRAARRHGRALREGAERHRGEDAVARGEALHAGADGAHDAGQLGARDEREGRLHLVLPAHHEDVEEVAARRPHLDGERAGTELAVNRSGTRFRELLVELKDPEFWATVPQAPAPII